MRLRFILCLNVLFICELCFVVIVRCFLQVVVDNPDPETTLLQFIRNERQSVTYLFSLKN